MSLEEVPPKAQNIQAEKESDEEVDLGKLVVESGFCRVEHGGVGLQPHRRTPTFNCGQSGRLEQRHGGLFLEETISPTICKVSRNIYSKHRFPLMMPSSKNPEEHIAGVLLSRAHSPITTEKLFTEKVKQRPLLLHPTTTPSASDERSRRRLTRLRKKEYFLKKQKPRPLSAKEKRKLGVYDIPKEEQKYEIYEKLNALWVEYMQDVLGMAGKGEQGISVAGHGSLLATADFHGAILEVVRSRCVDRVGVKGIVVRDTKFTFVVITKENDLKSKFCFCSMEVG